MGGIRVLVNLAKSDPFDAGFRELGSIIWRTALQVVDIDSMAEDSPSAFHNKIVGIFTNVLGLALIAHSVVCDCAMIIVPNTSMPGEKVRACHSSHKRFS